MRPNRPMAAGCAAIVGLLAALATGPTFAQDQAAPGTQEGTQVLTQGPIHEAFAEATTANPEPGLVVPKAPPNPIEEVAPDQAPTDGDYVWIPGYWGWDEDRQDYIWISGVWRIPPPGAEWIPGYWTQVDNGYQWVAGYWWYRENAEEQLSYLPTPPQSIESGPSSPAPGSDYFWVPGCWIWRDTRYLWEAGYWAQGVPDWIWIPSRYVWAPSGCVFIAGHWDYTLDRRGMLFAPVYFDRAVYTQPQFRYVPSIVINVNINVIQVNLFLRPRYSHYYFGDYYDPHYRQIGIEPCFAYHTDRRGYDPLFAYAYWHHGRHDEKWLGHIRETYDHRVRDVHARPPRTYRDFERWASEHQDHGDRGRLVASLSDVSRTGNLPFRLEQISPERRNQITEREQRIREFAKERVDIERDVRQRADREGPQRQRPLDAKLPRSPFAQTRPERRGQQGLTEAERQPGQGGPERNVPDGPPRAAPGAERPKPEERQPGATAGQLPREEPGRTARRPDRPGEQPSERSGERPGRDQAPGQQAPGQQAPGQQAPGQQGPREQQQREQQQRERQERERQERERRDRQQQEPGQRGPGQQGPGQQQSPGQRGPEQQGFDRQGPGQQGPREQQEQERRDREQQGQGQRGPGQQFQQGPQGRSGEQPGGRRGGDEGRRGPGAIDRQQAPGQPGSGEGAGARDSFRDRGGQQGPTSPGFGRSQDTQQQRRAARPMQGPEQQSPQFRGAPGPSRQGVQPGGAKDRLQQRSRVPDSRRSQDADRQTPRSRQSQDDRGRSASPADSPQDRSTPGATEDGRSSQRGRDSKDR